MVSVGKELQHVRGTHGLDAVSSEQAGDVVSRKEVERAYKTLDKIKKFREAQMKLALELGEALKEVRDNRWFKLYGYESFESWLSSPEIDVDKSNAYRYIKVLERCVLTGAFTKDELYDKSISKIEMLLPYITPDEKGWVKRKKEVEGMLDLSRIDLTLHLNEQMADTRYTPPERQPKNALAQRGTVTDAEFIDISDAKKKSTEASRDTAPAKTTDADAAFTVAVGAMRIVSASDVKKELALGGWYKLVAEEPSTGRGKEYASVTIHAAKVKRVGSEIYIDIEIERNC